MNKRAIIEIAVSATAGVAIGYGVGRFVTDRKLKAAFDEINREIENIQDLKARMEKSGVYSDPSSAAEFLINDKQDEDVWATYEGNIQGYEPEDENLDKVELGRSKVAEILDRDYEPEEEAASRPAKHRQSFVEAEESETQNIFDQPSEEPEPEEPVKLDRDPGVPYIITTQEYMDDYESYEKGSLKYFRQENILISNDDDSIVPDHDIVGEENLKKFGELSDSEDSVHIRNEWLGTDFEILLGEGSYLAHLGIEIDEEDEGPRVKKMRNERND